MAHDGYAYAALADGARPYHHRAGVRALLGAAEETGVRVSFAPAVRGRSFRYVREYQGDTAAPSGWDDVLAEVAAEAGTGGRGRLTPPATQLAPGTRPVEGLATLEEGAADPRASHDASSAAPPRRPHDAEPEAVADSYARAVLVDGAQPYLHRSGARALLGVAEDTGVRTSFTSAGRGRSFHYVHEGEDSSTAPSGWDDVLARTEAVRTNEVLPREPEPGETVATAVTPVIVDMVVPGGRTRAATTAVVRRPEPVVDSGPLSSGPAKPRRTEEPAVSRLVKASDTAPRPVTEVPVSEGELAEGATEKESVNAVRSAPARVLRSELPTVSLPVSKAMPATVARPEPAAGLVPTPIAASISRPASEPTSGPESTPSAAPRHAPHSTPRHVPARSRTLPTARPIAHPETIDTSPEPDPADPFTPSLASPTSPRRHVTPPYRRSAPPPTAAPTPPQRRPAEPTPTAPQASAPTRTPVPPQVVVVRAPAEPSGEAAFWERRHLGRFLNGVVR